MTVPPLGFQRTAENAQHCRSLDLSDLGRYLFEFEDRLHRRLL
jgi:hypothetical protein